MNFTEVQATSDYTISYTWSDQGVGGGGVVVGEGAGGTKPLWKITSGFS